MILCRVGRIHQPLPIALTRSPALRSTLPSTLSLPLYMHPSRLQCAREIGLQRPLAHVTYGVRGHGGHFSFLTPRANTSEHRWECSSHLTALHSMSAVALANTLMGCPGYDDVRNVCSALVTRFSVVLTLTNSSSPSTLHPPSSPTPLTPHPSPHTHTLTPHPTPLTPHPTPLTQVRRLPLASAIRPHSSGQRCSSSAASPRASTSTTSMYSMSRSSPGSSR